MVNITKRSSIIFASALQNNFHDFLVYSFTNYFSLRKFSEFSFKSFSSISWKTPQGILPHFVYDICLEIWSGILSNKSCQNKKKNSFAKKKKTKQIAPWMVLENPPGIPFSKSYTDSYRFFFSGFVKEWILNGMFKEFLYELLQDFLQSF